MNNFQRWAAAINPVNSTFFAGWFWQELQPNWMNTSGESAWSKHETRADWSADELCDRLKEIGVAAHMVGGNCPVQVEAAVVGQTQPLYFRARGQGWSCEIEGTDFYAEGDYGQEPFAAGYMPLSEVFVRIKQSLEDWEMMA